MKEICFITDLLGKKDEFDKLGVFDAIITKDSYFCINILLLKETKNIHFYNSYNRINHYFSSIIKLLKNANSKDDIFYKRALKSFNFHGVKGINLGYSETGIDAAFGKELSKKVISNAYDIVKAGTCDPEIFHLLGLFDENIAGDRISDMIASLISEDIINYTKWINNELGINAETYPNIEFKDGIVINPYKKCELLYLPKEILHKLPIAREWSEMRYAIEENEVIRDEVNNCIAEIWDKMSLLKRKEYIKDNVFKNQEKCSKLIYNYKNTSIKVYDISSNFDYNASYIFKQIKETGVFDFLEHSNKKQITSYEAAIKVLDIFKDSVENHKCWELIKDFPTNKKEKYIQRLIHMCGDYYCKNNNIDISFEPNEGNGPADIKTSVGNDKTVIEIKLSSNKQYFHGFTSQIHEYAISEGTEKMIFVYVKNEEHKVRDEKLLKEYEKRKASGIIYPYLFIINAIEKKSASI